jgi:hypothetical protein
VRNVIVFALVLLPAVALGDDWQSLGSFGGHDYVINLSTIQHGERSDTKSAVVGTWVRKDDGVTRQVWVDCAARWAQTYNGDLYGWTLWAPIPPDTSDWAVWEQLCRPKAKKHAEPAAK